MSDNEENPDDEKPFFIDRAKQGRATCKKCKNKLLKGELRLAKVAPNMFGSGKMKMWHHPACLFETFMKQRPTTKRLEGPDDIGNWDSIDTDDQNDILRQIEEFEKAYSEKTGIKITPKKKTPAKKKDTSDNASSHSSFNDSASESFKVCEFDKSHKDNAFREFRRLCADISNVSSYLDKTALVRDLFLNGRDGKGFKGNVEQWCRMLLPGAVKRIYNLQSKQLLKLFSRIFHTDFDDMLVDLERGDVAETITKFFEKSTKIQPASKSLLTMDDVDEFLEQLSAMTKEDEQTYHLKKMTKKCTPNDLKMVVRLIKHDLRINAGPKHILEAIHADAYTMFQSSRDLKSILAKAMGNSTNIKTSSVATKTIKAKISLMTPVLPMLAEPCKSIEMAMKKCPNGMYSEIKYDGERVQVHKQGSEFKYFSRSLKPVVTHKVNHFKEFIPQAFPHGKDLILDSEILMIDTETGKPLPFGTLGIHKKNEVKNANVCLFVFDCIYYNGEILTDKPIMERRKILHENMIQIENHIMFSEMKLIKEPDVLASMIIDTLKLNLEGLVLKDLHSIYEPGKRHWLKVKKDYLFDGSIADSADLVVLGAWYGTGKKGGMMSIFLMGCYDPMRKNWCTVTKVHTGHDDKTLESLQTELDMIKISCDPEKVPDWLRVTKTMIPDFVAKDPKKQPVWEITGAEFTQHDVHTADGISVRFPRVTRIRTDKDWNTATSLPELKDLMKKSKENIDDTLFTKLKEYLDENKIYNNVKVEDMDSKNSDDEKDTSTNSDTSSIKTELLKIKTEKNSDDDNDDSMDKKINKINLKMSNQKKEKKRVKKEDDENEDTYHSLKKIKRELDFDNEPIKKEYDTDKNKDVKLLMDYENISESNQQSTKIKNENNPSRSDENHSKCNRNSSLSSKNNNSEIKSGFPDIFLGIKLLVDYKLEDENKKYLRYFIAYGGVVVSYNQIAEATHILHRSDSVSIQEKDKYTPKAIHVTLQWLLDSVKSKQVQETQAYPVFLDGNGKY